MNIELKNYLKKFILMYVNMSLLNGVHYYIYDTNGKLSPIVQKINQLFIRENLIVQNYIEIIDLADGHSIFIFKDLDLYNTIVKEIIVEFYAKNKNFPKLSTDYNVNSIKKSEIIALSDYIGNLPKNKNEIDIYLYKAQGERLTSLILHEGKEIYKKNVYGFYLIDKDLEETNKYLIKEFKRKITMSTRKECLEALNGVRYTIQLREYM